MAIKPHKGTPKTDKKKEAKHNKPKPQKKAKY